MIDPGDIEQRRQRAEKCDQFAARCRERANEMIAQARSFDLEATKLRVDANRLEALRCASELPTGQPSRSAREVATRVG